MKIPFHKPYITEDEIHAVSEQIRSGWLTMGEKTKEFETKFSNYIGSVFSIALSSATAALHLSLRAIGLQQEDEVIVPAMTFASTAEVVLYFNAKPILADTLKRSNIIDTSKIEEKISDKTKAIIPVHYAGQPADMDSIQNLADNYPLFVIEDAAHALPAWYKNQKIGTIGHVTCFSFYATKTLTTGEGGMACTDDEKLAQKILILRLHGIDRDAWKRNQSPDNLEYDIIEPGYKYNLTDPASAMGIEQLKKVEFLWKKRKRIAKIYSDSFKDNDLIIPYTIQPDRISSWHLYPIFINIDELDCSRNDIMHELHQQGIMVSMHFIPLYRFTCYKKLGYSPSDFPNSEWSYQREISLPIYPSMSDIEIDYIIDVLSKILKKHQNVFLVSNNV